VREELGSPAVLAIVPAVQQAAEAVVETRGTDLVAGLGAGHGLFHLLVIGIPGDSVERDV
jgi:hypothetical protein